MWLRFVIIAELLPVKRVEAVLDECDHFAEFSANLSRPPKANAGRMTKAAAMQAALSDS